MCFARFLPRQGTLPILKACGLVWFRMGEGACSLAVVSFMASHAACWDKGLVLSLKRGLSCFFVVFFFALGISLKFKKGLLCILGASYVFFVGFPLQPIPNPCNLYKCLTESPVTNRTKKLGAVIYQQFKLPVFSS